MVNADHYIAPEVPIYIATRSLLPFAISFSKNVLYASAKPLIRALQHLHARFAGLRAVQVGGVGNVYGTSKSLCLPV